MKLNHVAIKNHFLVILLIATFSLSLLSANSVEKQQAELEQINRELEQQKVLLQETKKKEQTTLRDIYAINRQISQIKKELGQTQSQLYLTQVELGKTQTEIQELSNKYQSQEGKLNTRLVEIYKAQNLGYLELFFSSRSFSQLVDNSYYYSKLINNDLETLQDIYTLQNNLSHKKNSLHSQKNKIEHIKSNIQQKQNTFTYKAKEKQSLYSNLRAQRLEYEKKIEELLRNSQEIEDLIQKTMLAGPSSAKGTGIFLWPVKGMITSYYGYRNHPIFKVTKLHTGIDVAAQRGTKIKAADSGTVIFAGWWGGYGQATIIDHGNGMSTVYAHQQRIYVKKGERVQQKQVIGLVGSTGYSTGPHLHFEIRKNGKTVNPLTYLKN